MKHMVRMGGFAGLLIGGLVPSGFASAQEPGILELSVVRPWAQVQGQCSFSAVLSQGYGLDVLYDPASTQTHLQFQSNTDSFISGRLYQADIYVDFETHFSNNAEPLAPRTLELIAFDTRRFQKLFADAEEFTFGLDQTLYVVDLSRIPFPIDKFAHCTARPPSKVKEVTQLLSGLNPFAIPEEDRQLEEGEDNPLVAPPQPELATQKTEWQPFLTSHTSAPFALKPAHPDTEDTAEAHSKAAEKPTLAPLPHEAVSLLSPPPIDRPPTPHACGASDGLYEFSQIPEAEMPPAMRGLRSFVTNNNNEDEDKDLIHSLLIQMELLEKEKEALRLRQPEAHQPLSIIRSCSREETLIDDLKGELLTSEDEKFILQKRQEIQDDIGDAYNAGGTQTSGASDAQSDGMLDLRSVRDILQGTTTDQLKTNAKDTKTR